jgi:AraC-like DNA-binding protein
MVRQTMSMTRQTLPFRISRGSKMRGAATALHNHEEAQLIFAASGTMQVYTQSGCWLVPPQLAVWVPTGVVHRVDVLSDIEHRMIYWHPTALRAWAPSVSLDRAFALRVTPLLRELVFTAFQEDAAAERTELVVRLILHELTETPDAPTFLPLPAGAIGRRVAELAFTDPGNQLDIGDLASRAATSVRTISRLFPAETGLTYKTWRQRARIVLAIDQLSAGTAINQVAARAGFASTAAFCFAFRQVTSLTPTSFLEAATRRLEQPRPDDSQAAVR